MNEEQIAELVQILKQFYPTISDSQQAMEQWEKSLLKANYKLATDALQKMLEANDQRVAQGQSVLGIFLEYYQEELHSQYPITKPTTAKPVANLSGGKAIFYPLCTKDREELKPETRAFKLYNYLSHFQLLPKELIPPEKGGSLMSAALKGFNAEAKKMLIPIVQRADRDGIDVMDMPDFEELRKKAIDEFGDPVFVLNSKPCRCKNCYYKNFSTT